MNYKKTKTPFKDDDDEVIYVVQDMPNKRTIWFETEYGMCEFIPIEMIKWISENIK